MILFNMVHKFLMCICILLIISSCTKIDEEKVIGNYSIDKHILLSKTDTIVWWSGEILSLKQNNRFEFTDNHSEKIIGNWKIEESVYKGGYSDRTEPQAIISFAFDNKIIKGDFRSGIFYFDYPNSFRKSKYKSALYVKTNN